MRLDRAADATALLEQAFGLGFASLHCSSEYETFPLFRHAWLEARSSSSREPAIIAKVACPHFGEERFSGQALREKIQRYLDELKLDRLAVVQWLLRFDLNRESERIRIFEESAEALAEAVAKLKSDGLIGAFVGFPYTPAIAERLMAADCVDGLALYVNPLEQEMDRFVEAAADRRKSVIAIRPFAAGRIFSETTMDVEDALRHVFAFPAVSTAVISASGPQHLERIRSAFDTVAAS
jgi:aryl-alcohol dehydrogenase-like predicted oxidoreductase